MMLKPRRTTAHLEGTVVDSFPYQSFLWHALEDVGEDWEEVG